MSEDNKDFGEKADDAFDSAKDKANDFAEDAKKTADEFAEGAKKAMDELGGENKKMMAGILALLLGSLGIHKFVLGYQKEGIIMLVVTLATCGIGGSVIWIIGVIEGIIYLTKTDAEFYAMYQVGRKPWF